jgi:hypothetical protein
VFLALPCGKRLKGPVKKALDAQDQAVADQESPRVQEAEQALEEWITKLAHACARWRPPRVTPAADALP